MNWTIRVGEVGQVGQAGTRRKPATVTLGLNACSISADSRQLTMELSGPADKPWRELLLLIAAKSN